LDGDTPPNRPFLGITGVERINGWDAEQAGSPLNETQRPSREIFLPISENPFSPDAIFVYAVHALIPCEGPTGWGVVFGASRSRYHLQ